MKIQAAVLNEPKAAFRLEQIDLDTNLRANEILVKIIATGICHSDLSIRDQHIPFPIPAILGHEGAGIVERVGSEVSKVKKGDHVVLAPTSCGKCEQCKSGHPSYCEHFFTMNVGGRRQDGSCPYHNLNGDEVSGLFFYQSSFATYSIAGENNVVKVSKELPLEILGPLGCGIQTGAGTVINHLQPKPGESIAIFGVGPVGLAALMAAKVAGCTTIVAADIHENRLEMARELGATHTINTMKENISKKILEEIKPSGLHYAIDTTGRTDVINEALASLRFRGVCDTIGVSASQSLELSYANFGAGKSVSVVIEGDSVPDILIPQLIQLYQKGAFPFDKLIQFYDFEDINQAIADTERGTTLKAVLRMPK